MFFCLFCQYQEAYGIWSAAVLYQHHHHNIINIIISLNFSRWSELGIENLNVALTKGFWKIQAFRQFRTCYWSHFFTNLDFQGEWLTVVTDKRTDGQLSFFIGNSNLNIWMQVTVIINSIEKYRQMFFFISGNCVQFCKLGRIISIL